MFQGAESTLLFAVEHLNERMLTYVSKTVFRKYKVVTAVHVAIEFHHPRVPTFLGKNADAGLHACPVGQGAVEKLNINSFHVTPLNIAIKFSSKHSDFAIFTIIAFYHHNKRCVFLATFPDIY